MIHTLYSIYSILCSVFYLFRLLFHIHILLPSLYLTCTPLRCHIYPARRAIFSPYRHFLATYDNLPSQNKTGLKSNHKFLAEYINFSQKYGIMTNFWQIITKISRKLEILYILYRKIQKFLVSYWIKIIEILRFIRYFGSKYICQVIIYSVYLR